MLVGSMPRRSGKAELLTLFQELSDLKRVRSAGRDGSIATRLFRLAWQGLITGTPADHVSLSVVASAIAATRLGDLDVAFLRASGLSAADAVAILNHAFDAVASPVCEPLRTQLRGSLGTGEGVEQGLVPAFVTALGEQPRAGVTCPGKPRIVLEPPENHAEHCVLVAVYGVLLSPAYDADPTTVFLAGLAHHLHNAAMPDAGFTGEVLLGSHLDAIVRHSREQALAEVDKHLRGVVMRSLEIVPDATTPESRAFHAADVIDRVLQIRQYLQGATLTMDIVLNEMGLIHEGPVKAFHDEVLQEVGLR